MKRFFLFILHRFLKRFFRFKRNSKNFISITSELQFTVLITAYNTRKYCEETLRSVLNQDYSNYKIIYIDDCSTDENALLVEQFIKIYDKASKITLIKNSERQKKLFNLYKIISNLPDDQIIIELDGDDYFIHNNVLKTFNIYYHETQAMIIYANYVNNPINLAKQLKLETYSEETPNFVIRYNLFRDYPWIYSGIRSYYAGLFKKIHKNDLIFKKSNNKIFYPVCHDMAMFYPMLEMAGSKIAYIQEPMILRNIDSPINDFKSYDDKFRISIMKEIRNAKKYKKISELF